MVCSWVLKGDASAMYDSLSGSQETVTSTGKRLSDRRTAWAPQIARHAAMQPVIVLVTDWLVPWPESLGKISLHVWRWPIRGTPCQSLSPTQSQGRGDPVAPRRRGAPVLVGDQNISCRSTNYWPAVCSTGAAKMDVQLLRCSLLVFWSLPGFIIATGPPVGGPFAVLEVQPSRRSSRASRARAALAARLRARVTKGEGPHQALRR